MLKAERLGQKLGLNDLYIKDESQNPTASFKARGMTTAVSMTKGLGVKKLAIPSDGNAAGALAAYAARAGLEALIFMPKDTPQANIIECQQTGAQVTLIDGLITDCGRIVGERKTAEGWFEVSTLNKIRHTLQPRVSRLASRRGSHREAETANHLSVNRHTLVLRYIA